MQINGNQPSLQLQMVGSVFIMSLKCSKVVKQTHAQERGVDGRGGKGEVLAHW